MIAAKTMGDTSAFFLRAFFRIPQLTGYSFRELKNLLPGRALRRAKLPDNLALPPRPNGTVAAKSR